jgi:glucose/mannose-6-phosphate isomerase
MSVITHERSLENFKEQFEYAIGHYTSHNKKISNYNNIIIGGLGGSGIGGRIARSYFINEMPVPVEVFSDYHVPAYAGERTLAILCSYSGNTEETLTMFGEAQDRGCDIIVMAAGGTLTDLAKKHELPLYTIALGYQPRMTLGFALSNLLLILGELIGKDMKGSLSQIQEEFSNPSKALERAKEMHACFKDQIANSFVIVTDAAYEAVGIRICQQIQENAKGESFVSVLPEANHNMIESYYQKRDHNFIFLNSGNNDRVTARFEFLHKLLSEKGNRIYQYPLTGSDLSSLFEVIHATDWLSIWASDDKNENNMEVGIIMDLKGYLAQKA